MVALVCSAAFFFKETEMGALARNQDKGRVRAGVCCVVVTARILLEQVSVDFLAARRSMGTL